MLAAIPQHLQNFAVSPTARFIVILGFGSPESHVAATLAPVHVIKHQCVLIVQKRLQSHGPHAFSRPWPTRPQHGEVLPLKIVTYAAVSLSLAALLVAFVLLALVRTLRSNLNGIHKNLIAALFSSQLVFVIGIAQTENPVRTLPPAPCGATWARTWTDLPPGLEQEGSSHPFLGPGGVSAAVSRDG